MSRQNFAGLVKTYLRAAGSSQKVLANAMGINSSVLNHKLNGTSHFILTYLEIHNIVLALTKLQAITRKEEAQELLEMASCPDFSCEEWENYPLKNLDDERPENLQSDFHQNFKYPGPQKTDISLTQPLHSLNTSLTNLPVQLTSFIGREKELAYLKRLLSNTYLLTLTGAGGVGKTRLALHLGTELLENYQDGVWLVDSYQDGVWLVELAPLKDPSLVAQAVVQVMKLRVEAGRAPLQVLLDHFKGKQILLIMDNCEHLMEPCAALIVELLHHCPDLRILATSREIFEISGEVAYRVPSLSVPDFNRDNGEGEVANQPEDTLDLAQLSQFEAVRLFMERALAARPDFSISPQNVTTIARICFYLDGIPLAIELAATRVNYFSVEQILQYLAKRFSLLKGGSRAVLPRHQTLQAMIDWSHSLLSAPEQVVLRRLAVFAGGWTIEAAQKICAEEGVEENEVLDYLILLVKKSLVQAEEVSIGERAEVRYRMLETIRQYSLEKLQMAGEENPVRLKHLVYFLGLAEESEEKLKGMEQIERLNRLEPEQDNLRAALAWAISKRLEELALRLASSLKDFWFLRACCSEGQKWLGASLNLNSGDGAFPALRAKTLYSVGFLNIWLWDFEKALAYSQESLAIYEHLGDLRGCAYARGIVWRVAFYQSDYTKALLLAQENMAALQQVGDEWGSAAVFGMIGIIKQKLGDLDGVQERYEEALSLSYRSENKDFCNPSHIVTYSEILGSLAIDKQEWEKAARLFEECAKIYRAMGNAKWGVGNALGQLSVVAIFQGNYKQARNLNDESIFLFSRVGDKSDQANALWRSGIIMLLLENYDEAEKQFKECLAFIQDYNFIPYKQSDQATCLEGLAYLAWHNGNAEEAAQLLQMAENIRQKIKVPLVPLEHLLQDRFINTVKAELEGSQNVFHSG